MDLAQLAALLGVLKTKLGVFIGTLGNFCSTWFSLVCSALLSPALCLLSLAQPGLLYPGLPCSAAWSSLICLLYHALRYSLLYAASLNYALRGAPLLSLVCPALAPLAPVPALLWLLCLLNVAMFCGIQPEGSHRNAVKQSTTASSHTGHAIWVQYPAGHDVKSIGVNNVGEHTMSG
ncbi:hypothetical protein CLAIMM_14223, partial [Cladophialophora immunda]